MHTIWRLRTAIFFLFFLKKHESENNVSSEKKGGPIGFFYVQNEKKTPYDTLKFQKNACIDNVNKFVIFLSYKNCVYYANI